MCHERRRPSPPRNRECRRARNSNSRGRSTEEIEENNTELDDDNCITDDDEARVRMDVEVSNNSSRRIWGQIRTYDGDAVPYALVGLLKATYRCGTVSYQAVAHTTADEEGHYQFEIDSCDTSCYKVMASNPNVGDELVVEPNTRYCGGSSSQGSSLLSSGTLYYGGDSSRRSGRSNYGRGDSYVIINQSGYRDIDQRLGGTAVYYRGD